MNTLDIQSREIDAYNLGWSYGQTCTVLEREPQDTEGEKECAGFIRNLNAKQRGVILASFWEGFADGAK